MRKQNKTKSNFHDSDIEPIRTDLAEYCEMSNYLLIQLVCVQRPLGNNKNIP